MATGDLKGCLRKLQASLRSVKYPRDVDYQRLAKGDPFCCLPILSYAFTSFSPAVAELLVESGIELTGKNDLSFTCTIYKVLRDLFSYKPLLSKQQFLQFGFAERKISLLCDIIGLVLNKHQQLTKGSQPVGQTKRGLLSRSDSKTSGSPASPDRPRFPAQRLLSRSDSKMSGSPASPDRPRFPAQRQLSRSDSKTSGSPASPDRPRFPAQRQLSRSDSKTSGIPASPDRPRFPAQRQLSRSDSNTLRSPTSPDPHCTSAHRLLSCSDSKASESPTSPDSQTIPVVPRVERHLSSSSPARGSFSSDEVLQEKPDEEEAGDLSAGDSPPPAAHTGCVSQCALSAVEKGLRECVSRLVQLDARLQALERSTAGKVVMERSHWENLESRVVLLETSLALTSTQAPVKAAGVMSLPASGDESHHTEDTGPGSIAAVRPYAAEARSATPTPVGLHTASTEETIKERLERLANMMKDTSSLLKTTF